MNIQKPLAEQLRPQKLTDFYGQEHLVKKGSVLYTLIEKDNIPSLILWGPPGTGKTTLAHIIAKETEKKFIQLSAINSGVAEIRTAIDDAKSYARLGVQTILFIDEVHRFNKAQQDAFLPYVEDGTIIFIGATTENPSFEVNSALLSRSRVFVLNALTEKDLEKITQNALKKAKQFFGNVKVSFKKDAQQYLLSAVNGDARTLLNTIDIAVQLAIDKKKNTSIVTQKEIKQALQNAFTFYDKSGENHFNLISALHKSMRGNDENASLYYLTRMLHGGEDPLYIARRVVRFASEDIGLANSFALPQAIAAYDACRFIGMPECGVILAQAVVYMAKSKKSIAIYEGYKNAYADAQKYSAVQVPLHLRNAPTQLMKNLGYKKDYKYTPHASKEENASQTFLPEELKDRKYIIE